jgi:DNA-binding CsgD family transcriptional regulator
VKNHMKSIFGKLDVTNRAQAVAKLTRMDAYA